MKIIITESQELRVFLSRRIRAIEEKLKELVEDDEPCWYESGSEFSDIIITSALKEVIGYNSDETMNEFIYLHEILHERYSARLEKIYDDAKCDE